ncbi:sensor histidine kinase [Methanolobus sp. WCC4]|uniref:sensor histidine kinase n=1 Tax=Methanolobus sp. WCC4 TaxID=3125784 RepID=UPI0030F8E507
MRVSGLPIRSLLLFMIVSSIFVPMASCSSDVYRIGVLSVYGEKSETTEQWTPTAEYLETSIPNTTFEVIPLNYDEFVPAATNGSIDFYYVNPMVYVELARLHGAGRIATFQPTWNNSSCAGFGGVIITRADRDDIDLLWHLKGRSFMAVNERSFGGFLAPVEELKQNGVDYKKDLGELTFGQKHDKVVLAVLNGDVDAGAVSTGTLERMALEGIIDIEEIKVIGQKEYMGHPFLVSTDLYADWMFGKVASTPEDIGNKVSIALLSMPADSDAAIALGSAGWSVPASYSPVDNLMKELRVSLYVDHGKVTPAQFLVQYWYLLVLLLMLIVLMGIHSRLMLEKTKKEQLEESNRLKDLFADIMRHDLMNPVNVIKGFSDILYMDETDPGKKETLGLIRDQADHLAFMVGSAAKLAKLESQKEMEFKVQDIGTILRTVANRFSLEFSGKGIGLDLSFDGEYLSRMNDIIEDVFSNLVSNALKYSPEGSKVSIDILDSGDSWKVTVTDEGDGIPDEDKEYVFERFKRADKKGIKGTGLGLAIAKRIVDIHKGSLGIEDNPDGEGSMFWVMLKKA